MLSHEFSLNPIDPWDRYVHVSSATVPRRFPCESYAVFSISTLPNAYTPHSGRPARDFGRHPSSTRGGNELRTRSVYVDVSLAAPGRLEELRSAGTVTVRMPCVAGYLPTAGCPSPSPDNV